MLTIKTHIRRIFGSDLAKVKPLPAEATKLENAGLTNGVLQSYLAWRHSLLLVSLPALFISVILEWIAFADEVKYYENLKPLGKVLDSLPSFVSTVLLIAVVLALCGWSQWRKSALILKIGWAISLALAFIPALFPLEFLVDRDDWINKSVDLAIESAQEENPSVVIDYEETRKLFSAAFDGLKITFAIGYAYNLFPVLVTLPSGLARATHKIRGLLPGALLSSWILIISAPFYSIIYLMALILLLQVSGNKFLLIGALLLFCAPWIYIFRRRLYIHAPTEEIEQKLGRTQMAISLITILGYVFLLIWVFTGKVADEPVSKELVTWGKVFNFILSFFGRKLATTVIFSDVLLRMTVTNWRQDKSRRAEDNGKHIDTLFQSIESSIRRPTASEDDEEYGKEEKASERVDTSFVDIQL